MNMWHQAFALIRERVLYFGWNFGINLTVHKLACFQIFKRFGQHLGRNVGKSTPD